MGLLNKAIVTIGVIVLTGVLVLWSGSPLRPDYVHFTVAFAAVSLIVLWFFPETGFRG